jgi:HSP90 family molecular chaperone
VKGVVDSSDLPLNISARLLQQEPEVESHPLPASCQARGSNLLGALLAREEADRTPPAGRSSARCSRRAWSEDQANQAALLNLLRFASTREVTTTPR